MQRCDRTPRQSSDLGQIEPARPGAPSCGPFLTAAKSLGGHIQVDLFWLTARPLHDLDRHPTLPRRFQHQAGDRRSMAGDLAIASGPLAATEEQETLLVPGRFDGEVQKLVSRRGIGDLNVWPGPGLDELVSQAISSTGGGPGPAASRMLVR